jgi:hypothetical protein
MFSQQQIGFFFHGFFLSLFMYAYQKTFLSPRIVGSQGVTDDRHYVYHPHQSREVSQDTPICWSRIKQYRNVNGNS